MDWSLVRLIAQIALIGWSLGAITLVLLSNGRRLKLVGKSWALVGLVCFAVWLAILSVSIGAGRRTELVPVLSLLELATAVDAWGWLLSTAHAMIGVVKIPPPSIFSRERRSR